MNEEQKTLKLILSLLKIATCLILIVSGLYIYETSREKITEDTINNETIKEIGTLEKILTPIVENTNIENGNCLSYALHYRKYLDNSGLNLDVRKVDLAGICPIGTKECGDMEGMPHTYLIVNGYGGECILDQHSLVCIQVKDEM